MEIMKIELRECVKGSKQASEKTRKTLKYVMRSLEDPSGRMTEWRERENRPRGRDEK